MSTKIFRHTWPLLALMALDVVISLDYSLRIASRILTANTILITHCEHHLDFVRNLSSYFNYTYTCTPSKMPRLGVSDRNRIIHWWEDGDTIPEITARFAGYGVDVSKTTVRKWINRHIQTGSVAYRERPPTEGRLLKQEHLQFVDALIERNSEISSVAISDEIHRRFGIRVASSTVRDARKKLGWTRSRVMHGQFIRNVNKTARLAFALRMYEIREDFKDIIFTGESTFWIENNAQHYYRRVGTKKVKHGKPKHPAKVHVWGGISRRGMTDLAIFDGIMVKEFFADTVLNDYLLPFIRDEYPDGCRFMMAPKHSSRYAMDFMRRNNVNWWRTPADSPDMNPMEHVWGNMKVYIRRVSKLSKLRSILFI